MRSDVTFISGGVPCAAWLYRPDSAQERAPLIVMAHGFSATRECRLDAYAERFAAAGLGVLLFDYRYFGASGGEPRQLLDIRAQHADYRAAIAFARSLPWVDPARIALFGSSFSGGHALAVAAGDPRLAAVAIQGPFTDGLATLPTLGWRNVARATAAGLRDQLGALLGRPPQLVPAVAAPGEFAVMATVDAKAGFEAIVPPDSLWRNEIAARVLLRVATYRPGLAAARLKMPLLACVCDRDSLCPAERTVRLVSRAPRAEVRRYPIGHFDIYTGEPFERAVREQTEFYLRVLRPAAEGAAARPPAPAPAS
jgi:fermentation-respiration switch protein FrsA (DUF1100 family)